jgi:hypothetical protein
MPTKLIFLYIFRGEELETALMEMVEHDNRRTLSAKVWCYLESLLFPYSLSAYKIDTFKTSKIDTPHTHTMLTWKRLTGWEIGGGGIWTAKSFCGQARAGASNASGVGLLHTFFGHNLCVLNHHITWPSRVHWTIWLARNIYALTCMYRSC